MFPICAFALIGPAQDVGATRRPPRAVRAVVDTVLWAHPEYYQASSPWAELRLAHPKLGIPSIAKTIARYNRAVSKELFWGSVSVLSLMWTGESMLRAFDPAWGGLVLSAVPLTFTWLNHRLANACDRAVSLAVLMQPACLQSIVSGRQPASPLPIEPRNSKRRIVPWTVALEWPREYQLPYLPDPAQWAEIVHWLQGEIDSRMALAASSGDPLEAIERRWLGAGRTVLRGRPQRVILVDTSPGPAAKAVSASPLADAAD